MTEHVIRVALLLAALVTPGCSQGASAQQSTSPAIPVAVMPHLQRAIQTTVIVRDVSSGGMCAGFWADSQTVVTAGHCVDGGGEAASELVTVEDPHAGGRVEWPFRVVYWHPGDDVAVLEPVVSLPFAHGCMPVARGPQDFGDPIWAVGHPAGLWHSVVAGVVAHPHRVFRDGGFNGTYLQAGLTVWFGNSGGPAVNARGEVVGVASFFIRAPHLAFFSHHSAIRRALGARGCPTPQG